MKGRPPKPAHLRRRRNHKPGARTLRLISGWVRVGMPEIPNPDGREWHPLTFVAWRNAWSSPMASQWLPTDFDGLARLALLWDEFNKTADLNIAREIRLQSAAFGLTPVDRHRLSWEISAADAPAAPRRTAPSRPRDPRGILGGPPDDAA
jgi:hypothetical protein